MKNFQSFVSLTRDELRSIQGGAMDCSSSCTGDHQCQSNNADGYCGTVPCQSKPGGGNVAKKVCILNDPQNDE